MSLYWTWNVRIKKNVLTENTVGTLSVTRAIENIMSVQTTHSVAKTCPVSMEGVTLNLKEVQVCKL